MPLSILPARKHVAKRIGIAFAQPNPLREARVAGRDRVVPLEGGFKLPVADTGEDP